MADGKVVIDTGLNTSGFEKGVKGLPSKLGGVSSALKGVASAAAAAFSVKAVLNFGKAALDIGSQVAEVQNVVDTAFGDMAYKAESFADTAIEQFGMSALSAKKTASTYMSMARGMGLDEEAASDMAVSLAGLTGDVASFYNISQELADTKLKSVFTGETETLKDLGVVMTQANLKAYAMSQGITKSLDAMSQAELVALRYGYVTQSLSLAQGDFAKTSGSWANQTRILSEYWKEFLSIVGQGLIQVLSPLLQMLNQLLAGVVELARGLLPAAADSAASFTAAAAGAEGVADGLDSANQEAKALKKTTAGFDEMTILSAETGQASTGGAASLPAASFGTPDVAGVRQSAAEVQGIFEGLKRYVTASFAPSITAWGGAFSGLKAPVGEALASVGGSLSTLWSETLLPFGGYLAGDFVPAIANSFSETIAPIFGQVMPVLIEEFAKDFDFACGEINRVTNDILTPAFEQYKTVAVGVFDGVKKAWDEHGAGILEGFTRFKESLRELWDTIYENIIKPIFDRIAGTVSWLWDKHLKPLWDNLTDFFGSVAEFLLALWNERIKPVVDFIVTTVGPVVSHVVGTIGDVVGTVIGIVSDVIGGILEALGGLMDFLTGVFTGDWEKAWSGIQQFFKGIWDGIWGIVKGIVNLIIDGLNLLWGAVYSVAAGIVNGLGSLVEAFGSLFGQDWGFSMPAEPPLIPKLAAGAVLPPNKPFLALLGDQKSGTNVEAPLSTIEEAVENVLSRRGGAEGPVTIILRVGEQTLGRAVLRSLRDASRQNGGLALDLR